MSLRRVWAAAQRPFVPMLQQPRRLQLAAQVIGCVLQRFVVDRVNRQKRLYGADGRVDLPARIVGDVWIGARQLIGPQRQVVGVVVDRLQLVGGLRRGVFIVQLADVVVDVRLTLQRGEFAQILADCAAVAADGVIQRMAARNEYDAAVVHNLRGTILRGQQAGIRAYGNLLVHGAIGRGHAALIPVVRDGLVSVYIVVAGVGCQLSADAAGRHAHEAVVGWLAVDDLAGIQMLGFVHLFHKALPQRRSGVAAGCLAGKGFVVVVSNPDAAGIPARHAGKEHALAVRIGAGFAADHLRGNLGLGSGAALHGFLEHIRDQIRCGRLEYLMAVLTLAHVHVDIAVRIQNVGEGDRLLIYALVGDGAESDGHLHRRDTGGAQRQTKGISVDIFILHAHQLQIIDCAVHADVTHQDLRSGCVVRIAHGVSEALRAFVTAAAIVLRPGVLAGRILPAGNRRGHVVGDGGGRSTQIDGRRIDRQRLDGGADRHVHIAGAIERLAGCRLVAAADDGFKLAGAIIIDTGGGLRLLNFGVGAVAVSRLIDLVAGIAHARIVVPGSERVFDDLLDFRIQAEIDAVAAGAQLVFHGVAVGGGVFQIMQLQESIHHIADGILDIVRIVVHVDGSRRGFQHGGCGAVQRCRVFLRGDQAVFAHLAQHVVRAVVGDIGGVAAGGIAGIKVAAWIVIVGASGHAGKHGAFAQGELAQLLAEIAIRGNLHAVIAAAQKDRIEIAFQNLLLGVAGFQLHGQIGFLQLAFIAQFAGEDGLLDQLLGDGGAALGRTGGDVGHQRADNSLDVHAVVLVKAGVFHGDEGILQHLRNFVDGDHDAVLGALIIGDQVALAVIDKRGFILSIQSSQVQRRCSIDIGFCDADERTAHRQACAQQQECGKADGRYQNAQNEIRILCAGLED